MSNPTLNPSPKREGLISPSLFGEGVRGMGSLTRRGQGDGVNTWKGSGGWGH